MKKAAKGKGKTKAVVPAIRLKKRRNPNPVPPPKEYQFKPGQSGNPSGRPKLVSSAYKEWLAMIDLRDPFGRTNAELLAEAQGDQALKGNVGAAREIRQATEGDVFHFSKMSDDELLDFITRETEAGSAGGSETAGPPDPALSNPPGDQAEV